MRYRFLLVLMLGLCCLGMGKKKPALTIRFYTQTSRNDSDSFSVQVTLLNGQRTTLDQVSIISEHDIRGIYPFPAADGSGGCALKLDPHGTMQLDTVSSAKRGTLLVVAIDGRQVCDILIDKEVSDGIVTIPNGITTDEMKEMLKQFPVIGGKRKPKKNDGYSAGF